MPDPANIGKRVAQYIALRDHITAIKQRHKDELKAPNEMLEKLNSVLLGHLNTVGGQNVGTPAGTVYKTAKKSASIADMTLFWNYVMENRDFDMIDKKANTTAVEAFITEHGTTPPGVNFSVMEVVGVQRATTTK